MSTRAILSLSLVLSVCQLVTAQDVLTVPNQQAPEELRIEELTKEIRREKFDVLLPQIMREHKIDMWIHVMREGKPDPIAGDLGSRAGVFIFADRGGDRIERAVLGSIDGQTAEFLRGRGVYDIITEPVSRSEMPGGPDEDLDHRFAGVGEYVAKRDPRRIGLNYLEDLGNAVMYEIPTRRGEGISYMDYNLLTKAIGDKYAKRIVSAERLVYDYQSRRVKSEIAYFSTIGKALAESLERDLDKIVPGVTKLRDLEGSRDVEIRDPDGNRIRNGDYVIQRGDVIKISTGEEYNQQLYDLSANSESSESQFGPWKYGNFYETAGIDCYVLREGETQLPTTIGKAWADVLKVRDILQNNIKAGRTGGETLQILKRKINEAGIIYVNRQLSQGIGSELDNMGNVQYNHRISYKHLDPEKSLVGLDLHALGKGLNGPRISPLGPDWHRDMPIRLNHQFCFEFWVSTPMPESGERKYFTFGFHDGARVTQNGVEYVTPISREMRLIR